MTSTFSPPWGGSGRGLSQREGELQHLRRRWDGVGQTRLTSSQAGLTTREKMRIRKTFSGRKRMSQAVVLVGTMLSLASAPRPTRGTGQRQKVDHLHQELQQHRQWSEMLLSYLEGEGDVEGWTTYTVSTSPPSPGLRSPHAHGQIPGLPALLCVPYLGPFTP